MTKTNAATRFKIQFYKRGVSHTLATSKPFFKILSLLKEMASLKMTKKKTKIYNSHFISIVEKTSEESSSLIENLNFQSDNTNAVRKISIFYKNLFNLSRFRACR